MFKMKEKTAKHYGEKDFAACVRTEKIVPTKIYTRSKAFGFRVKERGTIFGNIKRGKRLKIKG